MDIRDGFTSKDRLDIRRGSGDLLAFVFPLGRARPLERSEAYSEEYHSARSFKFEFGRRFRTIDTWNDRL